MTSTQIISVICGLTSVAAPVIGFDYSALISVGPIGVMCAWLMWRQEGRSRAMEAAIDRSTRANLLLLIEIPAIAEAVKIQARQIVKEVDEADRHREAK